MAHQFTTSHLRDSVDLFRYTKRLAERSMEQCPDECLFLTLDEESNSIATIVKHMAGNMRSRWTDFLTSDGEKPDRNRDCEFEEPPKTRPELVALWEQGWKYVFDALEPLTDADLSRTVMIRTEPHSVTQPINRQIAHYSYHYGQITFLSKHFAAKSGNWTAITIPLLARNPPTSTPESPPAKPPSDDHPWLDPFRGIARRVSNLRHRGCRSGYGYSHGG